MKIINPSIAINAKALSKYGKRLQTKDYSNMMRLKSIGELVVYLKNNTYYSGFLGKISENVHRGELESILRKNLFFEMLELCKYDNDSNESVKKYLIGQQEVEELSRFISLLNIGLESEYFLSYPRYLEDYININLEEVSKCKSYSEFIKCISNTEYYKLLKSFSSDDNNKLDVSIIEDQLDKYNIDKLYERLLSRNSNKKEIESLFNQLNDFNNIQRIYRLVRYYDLSPEEIYSHLRTHGFISEKKLFKLCESTNFNDVFDNNRRVQMYINKHGENFVDKDSVIDRCVFYYAQHNLRFSHSTEVVLMCYLILRKNELNNIINIIEGVRYNINPNDIEPLIIY